MKLRITIVAEYTNPPTDLDAESLVATVEENIEDAVQENDLLKASEQLVTWYAKVQEEKEE